MGNKLGRGEGVALEHAPSCNGFIEKTLSETRPRVAKERQKQTTAQSQTLLTGQGWWERNLEIEANKSVSQ